MPGNESTQPGDTEPDRADVTSDFGSVSQTPSSAGETRTAAPTNPAPTDDRIPARLGRYEVLAELGHGGFGTVYVGHDPMLGRRVAIKVPRRGRSATELDGLLKEARRLAQLRHPGIVTVYDVGVEEHLCFIVTDLLEGQSLAAALKCRKFDWDESAKLVAAVADALAHAHALSMIHRDVKPGNVFLTQDGRPVLLDFGLAVSDLEAVRALGLVIGTPTYMSPEQARGESHRIDGRTDIYSLGTVLYQLLCGRAPFRSDDSLELMRRITDDDPQPPRQIVPHIPPGVEAVCLKAMAKRMADRFTTAGDFAAALRSELARASASPAPAAALSIRAPVSPANSEAVESTRRVEIGSSTRRRRGAERRPVSVAAFVVDAVGTSDPERQLELTAAVRGWVGDAAAEFGGTPVAAGGAELAACFGFPIAFEDAAARAVRAALAVLRRAVGATGVAVSAVVHTGEAVAEEAEQGVALAGEVGPVAARLAGQADPGAVVITSATRLLVQDFFDTSSIGVHRVRGAACPIDLFRVDREIGVRNRVDRVDPGNLTPLIGRDTELGVLRDRWELAGEGSGQIVLLVGDAGLGKSRLIRELRQLVAGELASGSPGVVEWRCSAYHQGTGFLPAVEFLERLLGFTRADDAESRPARLAAHLDPLALGGAENVAILSALLGIPHPPLVLTPQRLKERTVDLLIDWLRAFAGPNTLLFIVEDLHWADPSTLELLSRHAAESDAHPGLSVFTFRPEFRPPWRDPAHQTRIALNRLTKRQIGELMASRLGRDVPPAVVTQVAARTDGVPLFVEEFAKLVQESGMLDRPPTGETESKELRVIPATLQDLLLARLDRMDCDPEVVQLAAAIGREFDHELLAAASELKGPQLQAELDKLVEAELLFRKGRPPKCGYIFKHALIQDAAYGSLLRAKRQQFHRRIAEVLEREFSATATTRPEVLARHWTEAGETDQAIDYWLAAGRHAQAAFANAEALGHLARGLDLLETRTESPERDAKELEFQIPRSVVLMTARGYAHPDLEGIQNRARHLCERIGEDAPLFHVLWGIWALRLIRDEMDTALALADELLALATRRGDRGLQMEAWFSLAITRCYRGDFSGCRQACRRCEELEDVDVGVSHSKFTGQNAGMAYRCYAALSAWYLGYPDEALRRMPAAVGHARTVKHAFSTAYALHHSGWLAYLLRMPDEGIRFGDRCVALSEDQGFAFWKSLGIVNRGTGHMVAGRPAQAHPLIEEGLGLYLATGSLKSLAEYHGFLAEIHRQAGRFSDAVREADAALAIAGRTNSRMHEAELHRVRGEALLGSSPGNAAEAEACFRRGLEVAARQQARSWELRGAVSLARLLRSPEAKDKLAAVLGSFTDGFDTPDLRDAKELLDELKGAGHP
jgi:predicted ATPase